jgi:hypothetical protein
LCCVHAHIVLSSYFVPFQIQEACDAYRLLVGETFWLQQLFSQAAVRSSIYLIELCAIQAFLIPVMLPVGFIYRKQETTTAAEVILIDSVCLRILCTAAKSVWQIFKNFSAIKYLRNLSIRPAKSYCFNID